MIDWIWQHVLGPAIGGAFGAIPFWVWLIVGGLAVGWAWKTFGWQGLVAAGAAVAGLFIYRKGWKDRDSLAAEHVDGPDAAPPLGKPRTRRAPKNSGDEWLKNLMNGNAK